MQSNPTPPPLARQEHRYCTNIANRTKPLFYFNFNVFKIHTIVILFLNSQFFFLIVHMVTTVWLRLGPSVNKEVNVNCRSETGRELWSPKVLHAHPYFPPHYIKGTLFCALPLNVGTGQKS